MFCLLCFECNEESIVLDSDDGKRLNVGRLLFKYFQFCFHNEPIDGELCLKCWQKTIAFHEFCLQIESVHGTPNQNQSTTVKAETNDSSSIKCDQTFVEDYSWTFNDDYSNGSDDYANEPKTEATEPIWLPSDLKEISDDTIDDKFAPITDSGESTSQAQIKKEKKKPPKAKKPEIKTPISFVCKIRNCLEEFQSKEALIAHKTVEHRRIQCTHCPDQKLVVDLNKHLRDVHGIIQNSICEICGQVYTNTRSLQDHIQRKHEVHEPLQCDICKEWFKSRDTIRAHMSYVHVQGPQPCSVCGKVSANRKALRKHMTIHLESWKDRFKCIICGRGFRDNTKLKEHSYIHSGVTDAYECNFLFKKFRFGSSLSAHRMKYHPAEMAHVKDRLQRKKNLEFKV